MHSYRITFYQEHVPDQAQTFSVPEGTRLDAAIAEAGLELRTHCGGAGTCGKCQLIVNHQKVLACQTVIQSDIDVLIPDTALRKDENIVIPSSAVLSGDTVAGSRSPAVSKYGIALDIGTTTLAAELHDFTGTLPTQTAARVNPQRKYGDDVITRIQKVMENPSALIAMQQLIVGAINDMIAELAEKAGIAPQEVSTVVAAGNTVMQLLFFGIDPSPLGESPFRAPVSEFPPRPGSEIGLTLSPEGTVSALPIFGGFVGGDIVAGMLVIQHPQKSRGWSAAQSPEETSLFLDIGTNGELVLAHCGQLFTSATAAGPAFEGAKIEHGTLALPGAIDRVDIDSGQISVSTIGNRPAVGICGSGLIDAIAALLELGILEPTGRFSDRRSCFELVSSSSSGISEAIVLTQRDIRELQLASGAIRAGITLLLQEQGVVPESIETFYVAGGFGQSIRLASARRIGLLPAIPMERFQFCGNTSLAGARAVLLNPDDYELARRLVRQSHHCELAALPQFQEVFAASIRLG